MGSMRLASFNSVSLKSLNLPGGNATATSRSICSTSSNTADSSRRPFAVNRTTVARVQGGKVTKLLGVVDEAGMLRQVGVLPVG